MSNEIKRMRYFNGLLLKEEDLALEQDYHRRLHRLHNRYFHNWGIVFGLEVTEVEKAPQVKVSQGMALNRALVGETNEAQSQEIWICEDHPDSLVDLSMYTTNDTIYITVCYEEVEADTDTIKGGQNKIHIWERARIKHGLKLPTDPSKELILARVQLKVDGTGRMCIAEISEKGSDGVTMLRTYAIPDGQAAEFDKISIGKKGQPNLPYINGMVEDNGSQRRGIEFHSPVTKFSGSLVSGALKTEGDVDVKGVLTVTANNKEALKVDSEGKLHISKPVSAKDLLSAEGGLYVSGENANIDTSKVSVTSSLVTINKYTPGQGESEPRKQNSGIDVYRGGVAPDARLLWDETEMVWKAGTDGTEMYPIAYGEDWNKLHKGYNVDTLHTHKQLKGPDGNIGLSVDADGNIDIPKSVVVNGSILARNGGIEVPREGTLPNAKLAWNEQDQHWQIRDGDESFNILYGSRWEKLASGLNVDDLHNHSQLYTEDGKSSVLRVNPTGNVDVTKDLKVHKDLTVVGDLTVLGNNSVVNTVKLEVENNVITVNKYQSGGVPITEGGMEVYRGGILPNARIIWDEGSNRWKIGTGTSMSEIPSGIQWEELTHGGTAEKLHKHSSLYSEKGTPAMTVARDGDLEADTNLTVNRKLTVERDAQIKGQMAVDGSLTVEGDFTVNGTTTTVNQKTLEVDDSKIIVNRYPDHSKPLEVEGGLEVYRGGLVPNARIVWNEEEEKWKFGTGDDMAALPDIEGWETLTGKSSADGLHKHSSLCDKEGVSVLNVSTGGDIQIGRDTEVKGELSVDGSVTVLGDLDVSGTITAVNRVDMQVTDNVIVLNKFEGDTPKIVESGVEIFRGNPNPKARLVWDEASGKWKLGIGTELKEIVCGDQWDTLVKEENADALHLHGQLYNENGDILALSTSAGGNVDVAHALSVGQDLTVLGNLEVKGSLAAINTEIFEVRGNTILVNRYEADSAPPEVESGLKVFRGNNNPNASIMWDEASDSWKIGLLNQTEGLIVKSDGSLNASGGIKAAAADFDGGIHADNANFDGSLNAGSANVQGSLTVKNGMEVVRDPEYNAHVKWNETSKHWNIGTTAKTGIIVTENGNVGIGIDVPAACLDVKGNAVIGTEVEIGGNSLIKGNAQVKGKTTLEGDTQIGGKLTSKSGFMDGDLKITGNLVTGTGLEVDRGKEADGSARPPAKFIWDSVRNTWVFGTGSDLKELMLSDHIHTKLFTEDRNCVSVATANNGYVGIGTDQPQSKLHVIGDVQIDGKITAKTGLELTRGGTTPKAKLYWDETNGGRWQAGIEGNMKEISLSGHRHNVLYTSDNGTAIVNVDKNGRVGIGKAEPETRLDVAGALQAVGVTIGNVIDGGSIKFNRGTQPHAELYWDDNSGKWNAGIAGELKEISLNGHKHQSISSANGTEALTADAEGNIGIGTTTPSARLEVNGNTTVKGKLDVIDADVSGSLTVSKGIDVARASNPKAQIVWDSTGNKWQAGTSDSLKDISLSDHSHQKLLTTGGTDALIVNAAGNIGIGIAAPAEKLEINGNTVVKGKINAVDADISGSLTVSKGIEVTRGSSPKAQIVWDSTGNKWQAGTSDSLKDISLSDHFHQKLLTASGTDALIVSAAGKIGIGTAAPSAKLEVNGDAVVKTKLSTTDADISGSLTVSKGIDVARGSNPKAQIIWDSTGNKWQAGTSDNLKDISLSDHSHQKLTVGGIDALIVNAEGNIGIGTATPTEKLEVNGSAVVKAKLTTTDADISGSLTVSKGIDVIRGTDPKAQIAWDSVNNKWQAGTEGDLKDIALNGHNHQALYTADNTEAVIVDSHGNVGIGKTPGDGIKLEVDGDVRVGTLTQTSSRIYKENISSLPVKTAMELLNKLNPVAFDYKTGNSKKHNIGFIAEEVPDIFTTSDRKSVALMDIIGVLTTVVKKQHKETTALQKQVTTLQKQVASLIGT